MSGSINKVILIGSVQDEPVIRSTQTGSNIASFTVITTETWKDKTSGQPKERHEWTKISCMQDWLVKIVEQYVHKGNQVYIEGKLSTRKWTDKSGKDNYTTEVQASHIVLLDAAVKSQSMEVPL